MTEENEQTIDYVQKYINKLNSEEYKTIIQNLENIHKAKKMVDTLDKKYFNLTTLNDISDPLLSIVMTTYERVTQTHFTVKTISTSAIKDKIQIIIVDDSKESSLDLNVLAEYGVCIYYIRIMEKFWINPCVNYNLGFKFIKASKVIIQNGEVFHVGDVSNFVNQQLSDSRYLVFDVAAVKNMGCNDTMYKMDINYQNFSQFQRLFERWYQSMTMRNFQYHFLTAISKCDLDLIGGFDYDLSFGGGYDDDQFIYKIRMSHIKIVNIPHNYQLFGIHQWHTQSIGAWCNGYDFNGRIFESKLKYHDEHKDELPNGYQGFIYFTNFEGEESYQKVYDILKRLG